nr:hypothetical protein [Mesorhizobium sp.]
MPFYETRPTVSNLVDLPMPEQEDDPTLSETLGAAWRTQSVIGSAMSMLGTDDAYKVEEGFNPIDWAKEQPDLVPHIEEFAGISNRRAAEVKRTQVLRENRDRMTLDSSGVMGAVASMAVGIPDLPTLLPLGVVGRGARGFQLLRQAAVGAGLDAAVSEAGLQATQATRTGEETTLNIGGSIVLGGALGTLAGRYLNGASSHAIARKIERQERDFEDIDRAFSQAQSAGAAAADRGPTVLKDEAIISKLPIVNRQDPLIRLQLGRLDAGRQVVRQLAETPLEYADNAIGVATERGGSVETRIKMWNAPLARDLRSMDTIYASYFHKTPEPTAWQRRLSPALSEWDRMRGGQRLTFKQFKEEVGRAAYMGGEHEIPEVRQAAAVYRDFDDLLKRAAIQAGIFSEDVKVAGDISHRFRMYNKERIIAERGVFRGRLVDFFMSGQASAGIRAEEIALGNTIVRADRTLERFEQATRRLTGIEDRLSGRALSRTRRGTALDALRRDRDDVLKTRAPKPLVDMLRGSDENAVMIDAVKQSRAAARSANAKKPFAERQPVLNLIKSKGGVRIGSQLDSALRAMDVTPKTHPGLFRNKGGIGDVDNFVSSEDDFLAGLPLDETGMYVDSRAIHEAIRSELGGSPLKSADDLAAEAYLDNIDRVASEWLEAVGLPANATVSDVRAFINRVAAAERNTEGLDTRISRFERELTDFDAATAKLVDEQKINDAEVRTIRDGLNELEAEIEKVRDLANASPRVGLIVDYATTKRDLFKAKLDERNLSKRIDAINRLDDEGGATPEILSELAAKKVDVGRVRQRIAKMKEKADKLEPMVPSRADGEKADEFANLSKQELESLADEVINNILGYADGRIPYDIVSGPRGALKERLLKIETAKIHEFVENDIETVMRAQVRTMAPDIELQKKFGSIDMAEEIRKINDEADMKAAKAENKSQARAIDKARKAAIRDVEGIRDRLRGEYGLPADPSSMVLRAGRVVRNINYLRLLGGMTISAVPDLAKVVFTHGLIRTFRDGFIPMLTNWRAFRMAAEEVKDAGTALDMVLDSRTMAMADMVDEFGRNSRFERGLSALSTKFGLVSAMAPWNAALKQFSGLVTMTNILRAAERIATGKGTAEDIRKLAASGIDDDLAKRIASQFTAYGDAQGGVLLAKAADWDDDLAREAFRTAVVRDVDRIIVTPGQDKPLWMSTELGKTVGQFKSFAVSTMQRTVLAGLQQRDAATLNGLMLMMGLGALSYYLKQTTAGRDLSDKPSVWAVEAFDKSGIAGWLMEANNISEKATRGRVGLSAFTGEQVSRYASRNVAGAFFGPSVDAVSDIFQVSGSVFAGDPSQADLRKLRQLLPMQNLFYVRRLLDQVEKASGNALGLPETRRNQFAFAMAFANAQAFGVGCLPSTLSRTMTPTI